MRWTKQDEEEWHRWFALWPVRLQNGQVAWMEWVEKKLVSDNWTFYWIYRDIIDETPSSV